MKVSVIELSRRQAWSLDRWKGHGMKKQQTITRARLCQLSFCNSKRLPSVVDIDGQRKEWGRHRLD